MVFFPDFSCCFSVPDEPEPYHRAPDPDLSHTPRLPSFELGTISPLTSTDPIPDSLRSSDSEILKDIRTKYPDLKCTFCSMVSLKATSFVPPVLLTVHQLINDATTKVLIAIVQKYFPSSPVHVVIEPLKKDK
jgi:hypothetical protein